jgi:hypothetical protein
MPINFLSIPVSSCKRCKLILLFLLFPFFFYAQSLTGLWVGTLGNDSTTVRKDQSFEIALTEYKGKVYGYSRSEFIVDDVLYFIVKRVKGTIEGDVCEVTDDEIISYNFPKQLDKKVKVTSTFRRDKSDSAWHLDGKWKTNVTKKYYSVTGKVDLEQEKDLTASKIFPHLEELKLADEVVFYKERKEGTPIVKIAKPEKVQPEFVTKTEKLAAEKDVAISTTNTIIQRAEPNTIPVKPSFTNAKGETAAVANQTPVTDTKEIVKTETEVPKETIVETKTITDKKNNEVVAVSIKNNTVAENKHPVKETVAATQKPVVKNQPDIAATKPSVNKTDVASVPLKKKVEVKTEPVTKTTPKQDVVVNKPAQTTTIKQTEVVAKKPETKTITTPTTATSTKPEVVKADAVVKLTAVEKKEPVATPIIPEIKKPEVDIMFKAASISGRKSEFSQVVNFKSDSLQISLYDNGEIDGDTVSVFMNGEVLLSQQGLKASAIKKTIYLTPGQNDEFNLVMFAESLGKYPPNTGLLVIRDGNDVYNLRFSSDFQKNAGIVFKRKK